MKKFKRSIVIPVALVVYLAVMAYIGRSYLDAGEYLYYFGVIGASLVVIFLLHLSLKKREKLKKEREDDLKDMDD